MLLLQLQIFNNRFLADFELYSSAKGCLRLLTYIIVELIKNLIGLTITKNFDNTRYSGWLANKYVIFAAVCVPVVWYSSM